MKRHVLFIAGILSLLTISGCKNIDSSEDESTNTGAYICIETGAERTIQPNLTLEEMTYFAVSGKKTESDYESCFCVSYSYEELLKEKVSVSTGNWYEFKLTANKDDQYFVGTISNKEIVQGKNTLHFTLSRTEYESGNVGNVNVTFKIPSATAVKTVKAGLYTRDTDEEYKMAGHYLSIAPSEDSDSATAVYDDWAKSGTYRLKAWFYADENCTLLVGTFSELVKIISGTTSEAERDIRVNEVYTITLNDEGTYESSYTPKTLFTRYDNLIELPSSDQMKKSGYTFLGWYTSADESGELVTEISGSQAENVVLYAKWYEGCAVSASTYKNADFASSEYGDAYTILLLGEWTNEEFSDFCYKLRYGISFERSLTLDMSKITGVTSIGDSAFHNGTDSKGVPFVSVLLPDGITSIGKYAFECCSKLTEITIPEGVTSIDYGAFEDCTSLAKIAIPDSVTSIGDYAFYGCTSLSEITIPKGVTSIGDRAFYNCTSLSEITIPEGVTSIGGYAFYECTSLKKITIPEGVTSIEWGTFYNCTSLSEITIPEGVTSIGVQAFLGCTSLPEITIPKGVTSIGGDAFRDCTSLVQITIPKGVTSIGSAAFFGCSSLAQITIPNSVTRIGDQAFYGCSSLTEITIPEGVMSIEWGTFTKCSSLSEITIPDSVTSIGVRAFYECTSLKRIAIPKNVSKIGRWAFENSGIETVTFDDTTSKWYKTSSSWYTGGTQINLLSFLSDNAEYYLYKK